MVLRHQFAHRFNGALEIQALSRMHVQFKRDFI